MVCESLLFSHFLRGGGGGLGWEEVGRGENIILSIVVRVPSINYVLGE